MADLLILVNTYVPMREKEHAHWFQFLIFSVYSDITQYVIYEKKTSFLCHFSVNGIREKFERDLNGK